MKNLLYKELVLCTNVSVFIFTLFGAVMMIVPDYPHYVGFYYTTLSVMLLFTQGTANNDAVYTACLPVRRRDIVKARVLCVAFLELFCLAVSIPSAVAAALFLPGWKSADGLPAAALYSIVFVQYALFNVSFLVLCYRKSGKPALAFFVGSIAYWAVFFVVTVLIAAIARVHAFMSAAGGMSQLTLLPVLAAGIAVWAGSLLLAYRICVKLFEKVNL